MRDSFKLAICQMKITENKSVNIEKAVEMLEAAAGKGVKMAVLPEMFNCPYTHKNFLEFSESADEGITLKKMSKTARELGIFIVAGSIPEIDGHAIYNTCFVFDPDGNIIGRYRKMHLFDVDIKGKILFKESDTFTAGKDITVIDTELCSTGIAICYDIRFPELFRLMVLKGARLIVVPAAFNMVTGPAHWELLFRTRAIDNQVYIAAASPAREVNSNYVAFGNSMIIDPWGNISARAGSGEEIIYADIEQKVIERIRSEVPALKHMREDVYSLKEK